MGKNNEDIKKAYNEGYEMTLKQLNKWNVKYHKLIMGKPSYDLLVDDKHIDFAENWITKIK